MASEVTISPSLPRPSTPSQKVSKPRANPWLRRTVGIADHGSGPIARLFHLFLQKRKIRGEALVVVEKPVLRRQQSRHEGGVSGRRDGNRRPGVGEGHPCPSEQGDMRGWILEPGREAGGVIQSMGVGEDEDDVSSSALSRRQVSEVGGRLRRCAAECDEGREDRRYRDLARRIPESSNLHPRILARQKSGRDPGGRDREGRSARQRP